MKYMLCVSWYGVYCRIQNRAMLADSVDNCHKAYIQWRNAEELGVRDIANCYIRQNGVIIADISYNGEINFTKSYLAKETGKCQD